MARKRCNACGGTYRDVLPDGSEYFHVCAPIVRYRVRRADGSEAMIRPADLQESDQVLSEIMRPRPNHRDENAVRVIEEGGRRRRVIKSEGAGVTPIAEEEEPIEAAAVDGGAQ